MSIVRLRVPVLTMILAATAIPVAFRPLQQAELRLFSIDAITTSWRTSQASCL